MRSDVTPIGLLIGLAVCAVSVWRHEQPWLAAIIGVTTLVLIVEWLIKK